MLDLYKSVQGFGAVTPPNQGICIGLAGGSYNSVSTAVLHCDSSFFQQNEINKYSIALFSRH